jgi:surface protein
VKSMSYMFSFATSFNQDISNWDTKNCQNMTNAFRNATSFNQSIGKWNVEKVSMMDSIFLNAGLSTINYDLTLKGWASQSVLPNVSVKNAHPLKYCYGEDSRNVLINKGWTFGGDVKDCTGIVPCERFVTKIVALDVNPATALAVEIVSAGNGGYEYKWNSGELEDTISNIGPKLYTVITTDQLGCQDSASIDLSRICKNGSKETPALSCLLGIYPNPATTTLNIHLNWAGSKTLRLFDTLGRLIQVEQIEGTGATLLLDHLAAGHYIVIVESPHGNAIERIIKQ